MRRRAILFTIIVLLLSFPAFAQEGRSLYGSFNASGGFFVAIIAGVILAAAFQLLLTNISGAAGLSAAKVVTEGGRPRSKRSGLRGEGGYVGNPAEGGNPAQGGNPTFAAATDQIHTTMRKISRGFGLMTLVTASIALFLASWLSLELVGADTIGFAIIVALCIWGISYLITFTLEMTAGSTMVGAISYIAKQSFRSITQATAQLMRRSEGRREADRARQITDAVRTELFGKMDLKREISDYIQKLKPDYSPRDYRYELESLIDKLQIEEFVSPEGGPGGLQEVVRQIRTKGDKMSREQAKQASTKLKSAISMAQEERGRTDKAQHEQSIDSALRMAGLSPEEAENTRKNIEKYLSETDKEELDPDKIKRELELLFQDPGQGADALRARLSAVDRDTVETLIAKRQDMSKEEVHQYVDRVFSVIESITGRTRQQQQKYEWARGEYQEPAKDRALDSIEEYIASLDRPTLDAEAIRSDLEMIFTDPKHSAEDLYQRARYLNREDIKAIVSNNRYIDREDVDNMVDRIMELRDQAVEQADKMKSEIEHRMEQTREEIIHQSDEMRKTAASATWWVAITAVASGATAVLGGWVAVIV